MQAANHIPTHARQSISRAARIGPVRQPAGRLRRAQQCRRSAAETRSQRASNAGKPQQDAQQLERRGTADLAYLLEKLYPDMDGYEPHCGIESAQNQAKPHAERTKCAETSYEGDTLPCCG